MNKYIIFLIVIIVTLTGCPNVNNGDCVNRKTSQYKFELPISIKPATKELYVGDTIFVSLKIKKDSVFDLIEDQFINLGDVEYYTNYYLIQVDTFPILDGFVENSFTIDDGYDYEFINVANLSTSLFCHIRHDDIFSFIEFSVVLKKIGTYAFYSCSVLTEGDQKQKIKFTGRCGTGPLVPDFNYNQKDIIHNGILTSSHIDVISMFWEDREGSMSDCEPYYFRVVE